MEIYGTQRQIFYMKKRSEIVKAYNEITVIHPEYKRWPLYIAIAKKTGVSRELVKKVIEDELKLDGKTD